MKRTVVFFKNAHAPLLIRSQLLPEFFSIKDWPRLKHEADIYLHHEVVEIPQRDTTEDEIAALEQVLDNHQKEAEDKTHGLTMRINELREKRHEQAS